MSKPQTRAQTIEEEVAAQDLQLKDLNKRLEKVLEENEKQKLVIEARESEIQLIIKARESELSKLGEVKSV